MEYHGYISTTLPACTLSIIFEELGGSITTVVKQLAASPSVTVYMPPCLWHGFVQGQQPFFSVSRIDLEILSVVPRLDLWHQYWHPKEGPTMAQAFADFVEAPREGNMYLPECAGVQCLETCYPTLDLTGLEGHTRWLEDEGLFLGAMLVYATAIVGKCLAGPLWEGPGLPGGRPDAKALAVP
jgi:hypothetical protein